jgi:hypothetical protein
MKWIYFFVILFSLSGSVFGAPKPTPEQIAYFQEQQDSVRDQENVELSGEVLLLTSSLSTTYSESAIAYNLGMFPNPVPVLNQKYESISPDYNFGYHVKALYRVPPTRNSLFGSYTYVLNNGEGRLNTDNNFSVQNGTTQQSIQNDFGKQHLHLHMADLVVMRRFPMYENISFAIGGGLLFNNFHYFFSLDNDNQLINTSAEGAPLSSFAAQFKTQRKTKMWGLGPKLEWHFGFHFTKLASRHDVSVNFAAQVATLFSKIWSKGTFSVVADSTILGFDQPEVATVGKWTDNAKFQVIPNINLDLGLFYKYEWPSNVSFMVAGGYRTYLYWELKEVNRILTYRVSSTSAIADIASRDKDTFILAGPYLRLTVGF